MLEAGARGSGLQRVELSWRDRGRSCCMTIKRERDRRAENQNLKPITVVYNTAAARVNQLKREPGARGCVSNQSAGRSWRNQSERRGEGNSANGSASWAASPPIGRDVGARADLAITRSHSVGSDSMFPCCC